MKIIYLMGIGCLICSVFFSKTELESVKFLALGLMPGFIDGFLNTFNLKDK